MGEGQIEHSGREDKRAVTTISIIAVVAVLLTSVNLRSPISSFSPIADKVSDSLGASPLFVGLVGMAPTLMFALAAALSAPLSRAMTFRKTAAASMVVAAVGFGVRTFAPNELLFLIGTMVGLMGVGFTNTLLPAVVKDYFPFRITVMSMAYLVVGNTAMATASVVAVPLEQWGGWQLALGLWAGPPVLAVACWILLVRVVGPEVGGRRRRERIKAQRAADKAAGVAKQSYRHIWRHPVSWGVVLMFAMTSSMSYCFITWAPKIVVESGGSEQLGGVVGGTFALTGIATSVIVPWMVGRFRRGSLMVTIYSFVAMMGALALLLHDPMKAPFVWIVLVSLGCSTFNLGLLLVATRTRAAAAAAVLSSGAQAVGYSIASVGPFLFGLLFEATGSWNAGLYMLMGFNIVLLGAGIVASRVVFVDDKPGEQDSDARVVVAGAVKS
ncbi:CynX/NimT family MFS transporter [Corynebacterium auriscanis]|uniref:MFS transporter n=1 Tax=Corynebacterium TaxID=1716 RepID=UPI0008A3E789|nr:MFS transporter [Corynebacterium sp. HMSC28B08]OFT89938.1 MFS transporter permease [Corynebacterium sp. HMSC28B08]